MEEGEGSEKFGKFSQCEGRSLLNALGGENFEKNATWTAPPLHN